MSDDVTIPTHWTFHSDSVAAGFDAHVREQLPWYEVVTTAVEQIARHYIGDGGLVYDVGASTGNIGRTLEPTLTARRATLVSIEESPEMAAAWHGPGQLVTLPAQRYPFLPFDLAVCFLVLMFLRPDEQTALLDELLAKTNTGGAVVVVERTLPPDGYAGVVSSRLTLAAKHAAGVDSAALVEKELSLAGAQRPLDARAFTSRGGIEFFRFGDFAGYIFESRSSE